MIGVVSPKDAMNAYFCFKFCEKRKKLHIYVIYMYCMRHFEQIDLIGGHTVYSYQEIMSFVEDEDVKFIRLAFVDVAGTQKNISIMPGELKRAFEDGISFDASGIKGFGDVVNSDLFLRPDPSTLEILPWRPAQGRVVRMFCNIFNADGSQFELDGRYILKKAVAAAKEKGLTCYFGTEFEFYLFRRDDDGNPTKIPYDNAGYMDIAPEDRGENVRREICFSLLNMDIEPESSHHEEGPSQHEIDFKYSDALTSADNAVTFTSVVRSISSVNGLYAEFSPKPLANESGNGLHINMSVRSSDGKDYSEQYMAGVMSHIREMTVFLNSCEESYKRLGEKKAPKYVTWSHQNRSQLIRIPAAKGEYRRMELRSPDPMTNPYIAFALIIYAGLDGIEKNMKLAEPVNRNLFTADREFTKDLPLLPQSLAQAAELARSSEFIRSVLPSGYLDYQR